MILQDFAEKQSSAKEILQRKSRVLISKKWIPAQSELHWQKISKAGSTIPQAGVKLPMRCLQIKPTSWAIHDSRRRGSGYLPMNLFLLWKEAV